MKMLGQDVHTQAEFDEFKAKHHDPLAGMIAKQNKWLTCLTLACVILTIIDIALLIK